MFWGAAPVEECESFIKNYNSRVCSEQWLEEKTGDDFDINPSIVNEHLTNCYAEYLSESNKEIIIEHLQKIAARGN